MCGVLDASTAMSPRLTLGYRAAVAVSDSVLAPAGTNGAGLEADTLRRALAAGLGEKAV